MTFEADRRRQVPWSSRRITSQWWLVLGEAARTPNGARACFCHPVGTGEL